MKEFLVKLKNGERGLYTGSMIKSSLIPHGQGTCIFDHACKYQGQFQMGQYHGKGIYNESNGDQYEGEWVNH